MSIALLPVEAWAAKGNSRQETVNNALIATGRDDGIVFYGDGKQYLNK